ncbi:MAG: hypothetical protein ABI785_06645 [Gemmatimonadales bacterium]
MGCLTLLLFWLPVIGPFIAGLVGGMKAGSVKNALLAVFVPAVMTGVMAAVAVTYLADVYWGVLAGLGGVALSLINIGPLLLGAVLGGLSAGVSRRWSRGGGPNRRRPSNGS